MSRGRKENKMPKLTISGFGDEICEDFGKQLETMASFGLDHIDPRGVDGKNISDLTADEAQKAKKQLDEHGFKVACVGSPIGKYDITADFAPELEKFKRTLETTLILGADCIRIFSFFIPSGHSPDEYRDEVMLRLGRYLEASEGSGVLLLHENEHAIYGEDAAHCLDIARTMASPRLKLIFDPCNFIFAGIEPYPYAFNMLRDCIFALHIKDGKSSPPTVTPTGLGEGRIAEMMAELYRVGFSGFATIEPHLGSFKGLAQFESVLKLSELPQGGAQTFKVALSAFEKAASAAGYETPSL